jgi:predicted DNA-binding protein with PD1-like motif
MRIAQREETHVTLNFEKGEQVMKGLQQFVAEENITAAHIAGLGAASKLEIAYYNTESQEYERRTFTEDVEILNLNGNVGVKEDGEPVVHVHGTFGRRDFSVFGGHVFEMDISGAGEIHLTLLTGQINRAYDAETGLTLMCDIHE